MADVSLAQKLRDLQVVIGAETGDTPKQLNEIGIHERLPADRGRWCVIYSSGLQRL